MFKRLIDVYVSKLNGESLHLVNSEDFPNTLICSGTIQKFPFSEVDKLELTIYNLSPQIRARIFVEHYDILTVNFGYEDEGKELSKLFQGNIIRTVFQRGDIHTTETIFYVWDSGDFKRYGFFSGSFLDGVNLYDVARDIAVNGSHSIDFEFTEKLKQLTVQGNRTIFSSQDEALSDLAQENGLIYKVENNIAKILTPEESGVQEAVVFNSILENGKVTSNSGLIGVPTLTSEGLIFSCLINPKLSIYGLVLIDNSIVSIELSDSGGIPQRDVGAYLDPDGLYNVVKITMSFTNSGGECVANVKALARSAFASFMRGEL